jgi:hypothetical protein
VHHQNESAMKHNFYTPLFICLLCFYCLFNYQASAQTSTVNYQIDNTDFPNPERGFYKHEETTDFINDNVSPQLNLASLINYRNGGRTLVLRLFYLTKYKNAAIAANYLTGIQNDLNTARQAGIKLILRFAYNNSVQTHRHSSDASMAVVLQHIGQLKPIFQANADVIAAVNAGFVGTWGEWYYTHPDFTNIDNMPNYTNRKRVVDSLMSALPASRMVQIRTPYYKQNIYGNGSTGTSAAINASQAYNGTPVARLAHHNDCFLASPTDFGTYADIVNDKNYLEAETKYLVMGGETCAENSPRSDCINLGGDADTELARFHWSFLNADYNQAVLNRWSSPGNCMNNIRLGLGYRFQMLSGTFSNSIQVGQNLSFQLRLKNVGFSAPFNGRKVIVVLRNTNTSQEYLFPLTDVDPRYWFAYQSSADEIIINKNIKIPADFKQGTYSLWLHLADPFSSLTANPLYAVRTANANTWESATGYNSLQHQITVLCPTQLTLLAPENNYFSGTQILAADQSVIGRNIVSGGKTSYKANGFVELQPNFEVKNGAVFETSFDGCQTD